jgi:predicted CoA-substrate-specific enzyme activase
VSWYVGVDLGAFSCKAALMDEHGLVDGILLPSGTNYAKTGTEAMARLLTANGVAVRDVRSVVATGIGAQQIDFADSVVGDVVCTARGASEADPSVRTVIDIGSQATRVVWLDESGRVAHFGANEKCATGSGRFLQVIANVLRVRLEDVGPLSLRSEHPVTFTTGCAVFGESEAITRVSEGVAKEDILAGVHRSLADKIGSLLRTHGVQAQCAVSGGGALDIGLLRQLENQLGTSLIVLRQPQMIGVLGAAVLARRLAGREEEEAVAATQRAPSRRVPTARPGPRPVRVPPAHPGPAAGSTPAVRAKRPKTMDPNGRGETR